MELRSASAIGLIARKKPELFRRCDLLLVHLGCLDGVNKLCVILSALNASENAD